MPSPHAATARSLGTVAILGTGLIGGSLGLALRASNAVEAVVGWDPDSQSLTRALDLGAIDRTAESSGDAASEADLVVLAPPLASIIPLLREIAPHLRDSAVVTDAGSAKAQIVRDAETIIEGRFVGGHPMAGSEEGGIQAASADLFKDAAWILTPTGHTPAAVLNFVRRMVVAAGARPRIRDARDHDSLIGYLSHLPHVLAFGLAHTVGEAIPTDCVDLIAGSYRSGTRVAFSSPEQWADILLANADMVSLSMGLFSDWLEELKQAVESGDRAALGALLHQAHEARKRFPR